MNVYTSRRCVLRENYAHTFLMNPLWRALQCCGVTHLKKRRAATVYTSHFWEVNTALCFGHRSYMQCLLNSNVNGGITGLFNS